MDADKLMATRRSVFDGSAAFPDSPDEDRPPGSRYLPDAVRRATRARTREAEDKEIQLLSAILSQGKAGSCHRSVATKMLGIYGSLPRILCAPTEDLARVQGANENLAKALRDAYDVFVDAVYTKVQEAEALDYQAIIACFLWTIGEAPVEKVQLMYLDSRNRVTGSEVICNGSESRVSVSVRQIILAACARKASSFFIAHNHPGGFVNPSDSDLDLIKRLKQASAMMDLSLIDSIIVSGCEWFSFREFGYL